jgi:hypothetical protein
MDELAEGNVPIRSRHTHYIWSRPDTSFGVDDAPAAAVPGQCGGSRKRDAGDALSVHAPPQRPSINIESPKEF